jgi:hypothetical protein
LRRAEELTNDADLRVVPPRQPLSTDAAASPASAPRGGGDRRLPPPGTVITRPYKGRTLQVKVLADGFEFEGRVYPSLSAAAKAASGSHCNGFLFFGFSGGKR